MICNGTIDLFFASGGEVQSFLLAVDKEFQTGVTESGKDNFGVFASLYAATLETCFLMKTYKIGENRVMRISLGREGKYNGVLVSKILRLIEPYTINGQIECGNLKTHIRFRFAKNKWLYEKGTVEYGNPITVYSAA